MGEIIANHNVTIDGVADVDAGGGDLISWGGNDYISEIGIYAVPPGTNLTVNVSVGGTQWGVGDLQIDYDNGAPIASVNLTDTSTGNLDDDEGVGFNLIYINATTSTNLTFNKASFDRLELDGASADTVQVGFGYYQWINTGDGIDTVTIGGDDDHGGVGTLRTGDDGDTVHVEGGYSETIRTDNGSDVVTVAGADVELLSTGGDDQVDDDAVTISDGGNVGVIRMWDGNNSLTMTGIGTNDDTYVDSVAMGNGDDTVSVGAFAGINDLDVGAGTNTITVDSDGNIDTIASWEGNNNIEVGGYVDNINLDTWDQAPTTNSITVNAGGGVTTISLSDYTTNTLTINGGVDTIQGRGGNETITVGEYVWVESINLGGGTNSVTIHGNGLDGSNNPIDGGAGVNSLRGGNGNSTVTVQAGAYVDSISLYSNQAWADSHVGSTVNALGFVYTLVMGRAVDTLNVGAEGVGFASMGRGDDLVTFDEMADPTWGSVVFGGQGLDTADFSSIGGGVNVSLATADFVATDYGSFALNEFEKVIGTGFADTLTGAKSTASELVGGAGDDTYIVSSSSTVITETSGTDTIKSATRSLSLGNPSYSAIENAGLLGASSLSLTGSTSANVLVGNLGENIIDGRGGNDTITGGAGKDTFVFTTTPNSTTNFDTITDYSVADDRIYLSSAAFPAFHGATPDSRDNTWIYAVEFTANTTGQATTANHHVIYNTATGDLFYDSDGTGASAAVKFAHITAGLAMTASEFYII